MGGVSLAACICMTARAVSSAYNSWSSFWARAIATATAIADHSAPPSVGVDAASDSDGPLRSPTRSKRAGSPSSTVARHSVT